MDAMRWEAVARVVPSPVGWIGTVLLLSGYGALWWRARRASPSPAWPAAFVLLGVLPFAVATCSGLGELRRVSLQAGAWQAALLMAVAPVGLALGRPVTLAHAAAGPDGSARLRAVLRSAPARLLAFPLVTPVLAAVLAVLLFLTGWYQATVSSAALREATYAVLLVAGLLFVLPLVGEGDDLMPAWCTPGVRVGLAFGDGLMDAVAGIVVMTAGRPLWTPVPPRPVADVVADQHLAGAILLCVTEVVGLPVILASMVAWMRADAAEARAHDAADDARRAATPAPAGVEDRDVPWWLDDPDLAARYRPRPDDGR